MSEPIFLEVKWSVSRGRETYGYNICTLTDTSTQKKFRCMGGGYDMVGTVFGEWLQSEYQAELAKQLREHAYRYAFLDGENQYNNDGYYGLSFNQLLSADSQMTLDGACGIESMRRIAEAIGLGVKWVGNKKGHTLGYMVSQD